MMLEFEDASELTYVAGLLGQFVGRIWIFYFLVVLCVTTIFSVFQIRNQDIDNTSKQVLFLIVLTGICFTIVHEWFHQRELGEFLLHIHRKNLSTFKQFGIN
ncbi:hypothetical protein [Nostoc sp.]|uniref:hypothetical protein n=1 Tax=Nostoc sp. TaxID=1180 RepID=UPI003FA58998